MVSPLTTTNHSAPLYRRLVSASLWKFTASAGDLLDLAFPPACAWCGDHVWLGADRWMLCRNCIDHATPTLRPACRQCGIWLPVAVGRPLACPHCAARTHRWPLKALVMLGPYSDFHRELVLAMKRRGGEALAVAIGGILGDRCQAEFSPGSFDAVVPLPVPLRRRLAGSFDRCAVLAEQVSRRLSCSDRHMLRYRRTPHKQGLLTPHQRRLNVRGAFRVGARYGIRGRRILLVDDVVTTGATACEAARVLLRAGAKHVTLAVVARAMPASAANG